MKCLKKFFFCFCMAGMMAMCLSGKAEAEEFNKFGELETSEGHFGLKYLIPEDGYISIHITQPKYIHDNEYTNISDLYLKISSNYDSDELGYGESIGEAFALSDFGDAHYIDIMVGVRENEEIGLWTNGWLSGPQMSFTVSFVPDKYCEYLDDCSRGSVYDGSGSMSVKRGVQPIKIDELNVMYKGFLHGRGGVEYRYTSQGFENIDDMDEYEVSLPRGVDATVYVQGLEDLKALAEAGNFSVQVSSPQEVYGNVHEDMVYNKEIGMYSYTFKTKVDGTYSVKIGGKFGNNYNVPYSLGVSYTGGGWMTIDDKDYWYENGVKQGTEGRGKEIYDPESDAWYWLDSVQNGAKAVGKDVYQESNGGKWVRYDENGSMVKGWDVVDGNRFFFDFVTGAMYKGFQEINGVTCYFDEATGIARSGWYIEDGKEYWYENGIKQGTEGRGKEIYDPESDAWYWLDSVQGGAKAVGKDVYQESNGGKWVRYDEDGCMIKGWETTDEGTYYFDFTTGAMQKGRVIIRGIEYHFDEVSGILQP